MILTVELDGQDMTEITLFKTEIRKDSTDAISTADIYFHSNGYRTAVYDEAEYDESTYAFDPQELMELVLKDENDDRQFAGYITAIDQKTESGAITEYACTCADYGLNLDRHIINKFYENETDQDMILDALSGIPGVTVAAANLTVQVADMGSFEAKDISAREFMERVCELSGGEWRVDYYGVLQYYRSGSIAAPFSLSDAPDGTTSFPHYIKSFKRDFSAAANRITVLGGLTDGGVEVTATAQDTSSQLQYGVLSATVVDRNITDTASAALRANAEISQRAWPRIVGELTTQKDGLDVGQTVNITNSPYSLNGGYLVRAITVTFLRNTEYENGDGQEHTCEYAVSFGHRIPDIVAALRRLEQRPRQPTNPPIGNVPPLAIGPGNFASTIEPVRIVNALPTLPDSNYSANAVVLLTTDRKLYRRTGNTWTAAVPAIDLTGQVTETQISDNAISSPKIQALAIVAGKIAVGAVVAGNLAVDSVIAGTVAAGAIRAIDAAFDSAAIQNADINSLSASKLTAGTIDASVINVVNLNATNITTGSMTANRIGAGTVSASVSLTSASLILNLNGLTTRVTNTAVTGPSGVVTAGVSVTSNLTGTLAFMTSDTVGVIDGTGGGVLDVSVGYGRMVLFNSSFPVIVLDSDLSSPGLFVNSSKVVGVRQGSVSDPTGGSVVDVQCRAALASLLAALRPAGHGLIA